MLSKRGIEYLTGGLLLVLVVTVLVQIFTDPIGADTFKEDPGGILRDFAENQSQIVVATAFDIAGNFVIILFAAALYLAFRAHDPLDRELACTVGRVDGRAGNQPGDSGNENRSHDGFSLFWHEATLALVRGVTIEEKPRRSGAKAGARC